jgi:hypothetical protein
MRCVTQSRRIRRIDNRPAAGRWGSRSMISCLVRPMMTSHEEEFVHYVGCIEDLNRAWYILQELRAVTKHIAVHGAALAFALVQYAKPYTRSDGIHKRGRQGYTLPEPDLSADDLELHRRILSLRRQVLAHSDLTQKEAIIYIGPDRGVPRVAVVSNILPSLPECDAIIGLIERTLDKMYVERRRMEEKVTQLA